MDKLESGELAEEIERNIPKNVKKLQSVLQDNYNIVITNQCDEFLARCLRQKDGNFEKAIKLVLAYRDAISNLRQWDISLLPTSCRKMYATGAVEPLKMRDNKGRYIMILHLGLWDPSVAILEQAMAMVWMMTNYAHSELLDLQRDGFITIWDYTGFSMKHVLASKFWKLLQLATWAKNGVGGRFKEIHLLKQPKPSELITKAVVAFLSDKLKKRVFIHSSFDDLLKHVDGKCLPTTVGGELDPKDCIDNSLVEKFFNSDEYFKEMIDLGFPTK